MDALWTEILRIVGLFVLPDWGSVIALIPIGLAVVVVLYVVWIVIRFSTAGPTRRGRRRVTPVPPPGVHLGPVSLAPIFGAVGVALLFAGLVWGGLLLGLGVVGLVAALLFWGREGMRDYDHLQAGAHADVAGELPATAGVATGPPPGVHVPPPTFRPVLASIALAVIFLGLVFSPALLVVGILMLAISLFGWLADAKREYRAVEQADASGHLATGAAPRWPMGTLAVFAVLFVVGLAVGAGLFPPGTAVGGGDGEGSPPPAGSPGPGAAAISLVAVDIAFDKAAITAPADAPFAIHLENQDPVLHNVAIHEGSPTGAELFRGELIDGGTEITYDVPPLAAGTYGFVCSVHPTMTGTLTVE